VGLTPVLARTRPQWCCRTGIGLQTECLLRVRRRNTREVSFSHVVYIHTHTHTRAHLCTHQCVCVCVCVCVCSCARVSNIMFVNDDDGDDDDDDDDVVVYRYCTEPTRMVFQEQTSHLFRVGVHSYYIHTYARIHTHTSTHAHEYK
jgi:hypothetical protein